MKLKSSLKKWWNVLIVYKGIFEVSCIKVKKYIIFPKFNKTDKAEEDDKNEKKKNNNNE